VPAGEAAPDPETLRRILTRFVGEVFAGMPGRETTVGRFLPVEEAHAYLAASAMPGSPG